MEVILNQQEDFFHGSRNDGKSTKPIELSHIMDRLDSYGKPIDLRFSNLL